jgi:hypothetical protein
MIYQTPLIILSFLLKAEFLLSQLFLSLQSQLLAKAAHTTTTPATTTHLQALASQHSQISNAFLQNTIMNLRCGALRCAANRNLQTIHTIPTTFR